MVATVAPALGAEAAAPQPEQSTVAMRFFLFNMGMNQQLSLEDVRWPCGDSLMSGVAAPLSDGTPVDVTLLALSETRLKLHDFVPKLEASNAFGTIIGTNARRARRPFSFALGAPLDLVALGSPLMKAATYVNANLKVVLAFGRRLARAGPVFIGQLADLDREIGGRAVPNPKKSCVGHTLHLPGCPALRLCFVGAHFPMQKLKLVVDSREASLGEERRLELAKALMAKTLLRVLVEAGKQGLTDEHTLVLVAGDLNSRTLLLNGEPKDVLSELLEDCAFQALSVKQSGGRWHDLGKQPASRLPVTYRFARSPPHGEHELNIGDALPRNGEPRSAHCGRLRDLGLDFCAQERQSHFPACTDRVIYWAADELAARLSWRTSCEVLCGQGGSDHRPVAVEALLRVGEPPAEPEPPPAAFMDEQVKRLASSMDAVQDLSCSESPFFPSSPVAGTETADEEEAALLEGPGWCSV